MVGYLTRLTLRHNGAVTLALLVALVLNLTVIGRLAPVDAADLQDGLPSAAHCQGGGPGCAEQPLIPPPIGGLPHFDAPAAPVFGALVLVAPPAPVSIVDPPPARIERPPVLSLA